MRNFHGGEKKRISCEQAGGGRGRGRGRGRGPGKWTAASPSADFLASLRPVPNQAPGSQGSRPPPIILGPVAPPPVPMTLGDPLNPPALSFKEPTPAGCLHSACSPSLALSEQMRKGIMWCRRRCCQAANVAAPNLRGQRQGGECLHPGCLCSHQQQERRAALARAHPGRWGLGHLAASLQTCMVMCEIYQWIGVQVFTILALQCSRLCRKADAGRRTSQVIAGERNHRL